VIRCAAEVLEAIVDHARREAPRECCGLLIGSPSQIERTEPAGNIAHDPTRRYEIEPRDILAAIKRCRGSDYAVVGAYHSHPRSLPEPSETDLAEAFPEFLYLIAGPVTGNARVKVEAYRLEGGNFRRIQIVPVARETRT
jgi:proteasome lid subunit RPN8/RPN11